MNSVSRIRLLLSLLIVSIILSILILSSVTMASLNNPSNFINESSLLNFNSLATQHGINLSGYRIDSSVVKSGQTLSSLLKPYRVPSSVILQAAEISKNVFDVRRIEVGRPYHIFYESTRGFQAKYFIYEQTPRDYVLFDFTNPLKVCTERMAVETRIRLASGNIKRSLWDAVIAQKFSPDLVLAMIDIFNSTLDFRGLQKGDSFQVLYEEQYVAGKQVGIGEIKAAVLMSGESKYQAFRFSHHGTVDYYDENGKNLQKAFLISPLRYERVSSSFKDRRLHPIKKTYRRHPAIDYAAPAGTPVMSVAEGVVSDTGYSKSAGNFIKIEHPGQYVSFYMHLSAVADGIEVDTPVGKGDIIGFVGSSGLATGAHLDFRFLSKGRYVDYAGVDLPTGEPVDAECLNRFRQRVAQYDAQLSFQKPPDFHPLTMATPSLSEEQSTETTTSNL